MSEKGAEVECWLFDARLVGAKPERLVVGFGWVVELDQPTFAVDLRLPDELLVANPDSLNRAQALRIAGVDPRFINEFAVNKNAKP